MSATLTGRSDIAAVAGGERGGDLGEPALDDCSARVTFTHHGQTATGTLSSTPTGRLTGAVAKQHQTTGTSDPQA